MFADKRTLRQLMIVSLTLLGVFASLLPTHAIAQSPAPVANSPRISSGTESASPGDVINIWGTRFTTTSSVTLSVRGRTTYACPIIAASENLIQLAVPAQAGHGLYVVRVSNSGSVSNGFVINAPRPVACETPQVAPGGSFRVWGRNMLAPGLTIKSCSVRFVSQTDGTSLTGSVTAATPYVLTLVAPPSLHPGTTYNVFVNNGLYGPASEREAPFTLICRGSLADPFGLGVPWASDMAPLASHVYNAKTDSVDFGSAHLVKGDGATDDRPNLNYEISWVSSHGGGTLYLPASTYFMDVSSTYLECQSGVVLKGDGPGQTIVTYGPRNHVLPAPILPSSYSWLLHINSNFGATGITFQNLNPYTDADLQTGDNGTKYSNVFCVQVGTPIDVFFKNCDFSIGSSQYMSLLDITKLAFENNTVEDMEHSDNCAMFLRDSYARWSQNMFHYDAGRIQVRETFDSIWENNTILRDPSHPKATNGNYEFESGGLECSYSQGLLVQNSMFSVTQRYPDSNDGETILTQTVPGSFTSYLDAGTATGASRTTLTDSTKDWSEATNFMTSVANVMKTVVILTSGTGTGQWRYVTSHTANTLTLDHPWALCPGAGSHYAITIWSGDQLYALNNTLVNNPRGIELFDGGYDCVIANNGLDDSENISVRTSCLGQSASATCGDVYATVGLHNLIVNNTLCNTSDVDYAMCGAMALVQCLPEALGSSNLDNEFRSNSIVSCAAPGAFGANVQALQDADRDGFWTDTHIYQVGDAPSYNASAAGAICGDIFQGNSMASGTLSTPGAGQSLQPYYGYNGYGNMAGPIMVAF